ncbi:AgmX/PglI C-terminal domain-containing protein [Venatoribacter cucullus]|uniref:AgmX/PglI C-terminal domain-containing protein n=1 Tax=Venatoribacter cucullus TaxID=2661630 RepID=UPI00223E9368|nr:AgmX/PglI C-terminal domain-containing protein [Venatoribacter cucullus]UZK04707.1 AgmX/PglI C-terminal domain-containing protein [Venatoribacter cucullus]
MQATANYMALELALPWSVNTERDRRFYKRLQRAGLVLLVLFIVVPFLPTWDVSFSELQMEPTVRTQVILTPPKMPEPAKPVQETPPPPPPSKTPPRPQPVEAANKPASGNPPPQALAALSSLSAMQNKVDVSRLQNRNLSVKGGEARTTQSASLGAENLSGKRLNDADLNVAVKGSALGSHNGTAIDSPIAAMDLPDENGEWSEGGAGRRDMESIRRTIENAKGQVYALYAKALRQHPDLNGKFIFELVVEPDGRVTRLKLIQSDLRLRELEQQMLDKIAAIHFGKEKAAPTRVQYTFVMIPS